MRILILRSRLRAGQHMAHTFSYCDVCAAKHMSRSAVVRSTVPIRYSDEVILTFVH